MALSATEQTQVKQIITREGGLQAFADEVQDLYIKDKQQAALTALQSAISVNVTDWGAIGTYVQQASNVTLYAALDAVVAAFVARDATKLGPQLVALVGAVKNHLGK